MLTELWSEFEYGFQPKRFGLFLRPGVLPQATVNGGFAQPRRRGRQPAPLLAEGHAHRSLGQRPRKGLAQPSFG